MCFIYFSDIYMYKICDISIEQWHTYNNAHVTELRCVIIGNFVFSFRHQSEEPEMASF